MNVAIGTPPFELVFGREATLFPFQNKSDPGLSGSWLLKRELEWSKAHDRLWESRILQAVQYNKGQRQHQNFKMGDWVLLETTDRKGKPVVSKLRQLYEGPYRILQVSNGGRNCTLKLPKGDRTQNVFHVSKLKRFKVGNDSVSKVEGFGEDGFTRSKSPP
jgi:hypothetical protein